MREISRRDARRLRKRVAHLEKILCDQRNRWSMEWPSGTHIGTMECTRDWLLGRIEAARLLRHAVVVTTGTNGKIDFYALPLADVMP